LLKGNLVFMALDVCCPPSSSKTRLMYARPDKDGSWLPETSKPVDINIRGTLGKLSCSVIDESSTKCCCYFFLMELELDDDNEERLFLLDLPPMGTSRSDRPWVQERLQALQE
jgi:hypothetical protein